MAFFHKSNINPSQGKGFQYHSLHWAYWLLHSLVLWETGISKYFGSLKNWILQHLR